MLAEIALVPNESSNGDGTNQVSTVAGCGTAKGSIKGYKDGKGTDALFDCPSGLVADFDKNILVLDVNNHRIRKIAPDGTVSTLAGSGSPGFSNGTGEEASFNFDFSGDMIVDRNKTIVVVDTGNHCIRKVTAEGVVTTLAGTGARGRRDGPAATARFNRPHSVTMDKEGNLFIADTRNNCIRKINHEGAVSTFAGKGTSGCDDGHGSDAHFSYPVSLSADSCGNLFVADCSNRCIRRISNDGYVSTLTGHRDIEGNPDGPGHGSCVNGPFSLVMDGDDSILVAHRDGNRIMRITQEGLVTTIAGSTSKGFQNGPGITAAFNCPTGLTIDRAGNLLVSDTCNHCVRLVAAGLRPPDRLLNTRLLPHVYNGSPRKESPKCAQNGRLAKDNFSAYDIEVHVGDRAFQTESRILRRSSFFKHRLFESECDESEAIDSIKSFQSAEDDRMTFAAVRTVLNSLGTPESQNSTSTALHMDLDGVTPEAFEFILTYLNKNETLLVENTFPSELDMFDLHTAAEVLKMPELRHGTAEEIRKRVHLENLIKSYRFGNSYELDEVKAQCISIASASVAMLARTMMSPDHADFVNSDPDLYREFLESCLKTDGETLS